MTLKRRSPSPRRIERLTEELVQLGHCTLPVASFFGADPSTKVTRSEVPFTAVEGNNKARGCNINRSSFCLLGRIRAGRPAL
jgi:hypothetical protein